MEQLIDLIKEVLLTFSLGLPRLMGAMTMLSFLGSSVMGGVMTRNMVVIALSLVIYPMLQHQIQSVELSPWMIAGIAMKELMVGMMIGYLVTAVFWAIQAVGAFIDNQRGATMASSMDPLLGGQSSPFGMLMTQTLVTLFFVSGLFLLFLGGIYKSYNLWPVVSFFPVVSMALLEFLLAQFVLVAKLAVVVGAPIIIAMFLSEFGLGLISRFAPQLNVFFLSMSIKSAVANFLLILFWSVLILYFGDLLGNFDNQLHLLDDIVSKDTRT